MESRTYPHWYPVDGTERVIVFAPGEATRFQTGHVDTPLMLKLLSLGWSQTKIAELFDVSQAAVSLTKTRFEESINGLYEYAGWLPWTLESEDLLHQFARFCLCRLRIEDGGKLSKEQKREHDGLLDKMQTPVPIAPYGFLVIFTPEGWGLRPRTEAESAQQHWYSPLIEA